jgi:hypothetical protein
MLTMSIERSATLRSEVGKLVCVAQVRSGWAGLTDDDGDAIVRDEGDGVGILISHGDRVVVSIW